jgi:diacylglycerol kinase (ATP)
MSATTATSARPFTFTGRLRSFRYAFRGVRLMLASQHNAWVHAAATVLVVIAGFGLNVSRVDWCLLVAAIAGVWVAEGMNTAFEFLCDVASPEFHPIVEKAKDVAAGAVLVSAMGAVAIGALVFVPQVLARAGSAWSLQ